MRRIKLVVGALAVVVASFAAISGPAIADDLNCKDAQGDWIRCDGTYYVPADSYGNDNGYWGDNGYYWGSDGYWNYNNDDWGLFGPCGLFGTYDPYTGICY